MSVSEAVRLNATWDSPLPLRGCQMCDFGRDLATGPDDVGTLCRNPEVAGRAGSVPAQAARQFGGPCGPEATHLTLRGVTL